MIVNADPDSTPELVALGSLFVEIATFGVLAGIVYAGLAAVSLKRIPNWLRWLLVLPTALVCGMAGESAVRLLFGVLSGLYSLGGAGLAFLPAIDMVAWQLWNPLLFVACAIRMAPSHKIGTFLIAGGLRTTVAVMNILSLVEHVRAGGSWSKLDDLTHSPHWWGVVVYLLFTLTMLGFGLFLAGSHNLSLRVSQKHSPLASVGVTG